MLPNANFRMLHSIVYVPNLCPGNYPILATPLVRGVSAAVCCVILSTVLVKRAILPKTRNRVCGTVVKCLSFGLIAISVLYLLDLSLQLVHHALSGGFRGG